MDRLVFYSEKDTDLGKVVKKRRFNPTGDDIHLHPDGHLEKDEDKIITVQRIWKHEYYKPDGKGFLKSLKKFERCQTNDSD